MTYLYHCSYCDKTIEVEKSMSETSCREYCECGREMGKIYKIASIKTSDGVKQWYP